MKKNKKIYFFSGTILVASLALAGVMFYAGYGKVAVNSAIKKIENTVQHDPQVLGESEEKVSEIFAYKNNSYERGGIISFTSTEEPAVMVSGYNASGSANVDIYEADYGRILDYLVYDKDKNRINWEVDVAGLNKIISFPQSVEEEASQLLLPLAKSGVWFVRITLGEAKEDFFAVRSGFGAIVKEDDDQMLFWAQDFETRRTTGGISLKVYNLLDKRKDIYAASFDEEGIARTPISADADVAILEKGSDVSILPLNLRRLSGYSWGNESFASKKISKKFFTFTDRPLYLPGDTVYFKSIIRSDDDARYAVPKGQVEARIRFGWGEDENFIFRKSLEISSFGAVAGEFRLPEDADMGQYILEISFANDDNNEFWNNDWATFSVEHYRKPEYTLDVSVPGNTYVLGDRSAFKINGAYFSGQPLAGAKVNYKIYASPHYSYDYSYNDRSNISEDNYYGYFYGKTIREGESALDEKGQAEVSLDINTPSSEFQSQVYSIEAEYKDETGNPVLARKNILVFAGEFGIFRKVGDYSSKIGKQFSLPLVLVPNYADLSSAVSNKKLKAKIQRNYWEKKRVKGEKYPEYEKKQDEFSELSLVTDSKGEGTLNYVPRKEGSYEVVVEGVDSRNNVVQKSFYFWVSDKDEYYYSGENESTVTANLDKEEYAPGETARLNISSAIPDRDLFLSLDRGRVNRFQVVKLKGRSATVEIPLAETDMPNIFADISGFSNDNLDEASEEIVVSTESKKMEIKITPDKNKYAPGETATINIQASDTAGNPAEADVALWSVDKALYELADDNTGVIFDAFWSQRSNDTSGSHSLVGISADMAEKGGGGGDVRTIFEDLAYWNPEIRTDKNGSAKVSFTLPDNLTTWVFAAVGATRSTQVGQSTREIQVAKDIVVRPILPNILRQDDEIVLSAYVHNFTEQDHVFKLGLRFDSGEVRLPDKQKTITAKNAEQFFWTVDPKKANPAAKLTFSALAEDNEKMADIVTKEIPVEAFGFWETAAATGDGERDFSLQIAADSDKDKSEIELSVAASLVGTLPSAMKYLVQYPYGCVEQTTSRLVPALIAKKNQALFADALAGKKIDDIINEGLKRLKSLQGADGGWGWWGEESSDPFTTAYVVEYLQTARQLGYVVNENMLSEVKTFFESDSYFDAVSEEDVPYDKKEDMVARTYALSILGSDKGKKKLDKLSGLSADVLAYAVLANIRNGYADARKNGLDQLKAMAEKQGAGAFWQGGDKTRFGSIDASTALVVRALSQTEGNRDLMVEGVRYLTKNRQKNYWSNTFATAQVIQALVDFSKIEHGTDPNYAYVISLDGQEIKRGDMAKFDQEDTISIAASSIKAGGSTVAVKKIGEGQLYSTLVINEFRTDRNAGKIDKGLKVAREYINSKGKNYSLGVGDMVDVKITLSGLKTDENYAVIKDELPSGMIPINMQFNNEQSGNDEDYDYFQDGVTGREYLQSGIVMSLYGISPGNHSYSYKARVISEGEFAVPPAQASLMYSPEVSGRSEAQSVKIERKSVEGADAVESGAKVAQNIFSDNGLRGILFLVIILGAIISAGSVLAIFIKKNIKK